MVSSLHVDIVFDFYIMYMCMDYEIKIELNVLYYLQ